MKRFLNSVSVVRLGLPLLLAVFLLTSSMVRAADPLRLSRADYADRAHAAWVAQMAAVYLGFPFEHQAASVKWLKDYPRPYAHSIVIESSATRWATCPCHRWTRASPHSAGARPPSK